MTRRRLDVWAPLSPEAYVHRPGASLPFPLGHAASRLYARARHALWYGLPTIGLRPGDAVLVPAYHHGSEVEALQSVGLEIRYYRQDHALEPDAADLEAQMDGRVRGLYLIHYLGFPAAVRRWRKWCDDRRIALIEDAAQSWLATDHGEPVGSCGDFSVFCLYKSFGFPDGAVAVTRHGRLPRVAARGLGLRRLARRHVAWLEGVGALRRGAPSPSREYRATDDFALGNPASGISRTTLFLLRRVVDESAAEARRANYSALLDELRPMVGPPFDTLPTGAAPFAFPITVTNKARALRALDASGVRAMDFWSVPHPSLDASKYPSIARRRESTVLLPCHQALSPNDVEHVARAASRANASAHEDRVERLDSTTALPGAWEELAQASTNIFATREWLSGWWRHFGGDRELLLHACWTPSGRLFAILPLYRYSTRPLNVVRFLGHGPGDELGPICAPSDRSRAARALRRVIRALRPDVFLGEQLPGVEYVRNIRTTLLRRESSPVLELNAGWEGFLATRSANFRQEIRRRERRLMREHSVVYRLCEDAEQLERDLHELVRLHQARWGSRSSTFIGRAGRFQREFASQALRRGWLRLWLMELDGVVAAAWYGFRFNGVESYYQAGRDPRRARQALGITLLAHTVRAAINDGLTEYRFLRGGEAFKYRFATHDVPIYSIGMAESLIGRAALAAAAAAPTSLATDALRLIGRQSGT